MKATTAVTQVQFKKTVGDRVRVQEGLEKPTNGATSATHCMLQVARAQCRDDLARLEVVQVVQLLTKKHQLSALAQVASCTATTIRFETTGGETRLVDCPMPPSASVGGYGANRQYRVLLQRKRKQERERERALEL